MSISSGMLLSTEMSWSSTTFSLGVLTTNSLQIGQFPLTLAHDADLNAMVGWLISFSHTMLYSMQWLVGWLISFQELSQQTTVGLSTMQHTTECLAK
jgi:hypothetical protein